MLTRVNSMIRVPRVRVVGADGEPLGIVPTTEAIEMAATLDLDLVEVAPKAEPPVCRIMDHGKYKYEKAKKEKIAKKKQHVMHLKEIKMHPKTDQHDYEFKIGHARKFLLGGDRVRTTVVFRGREITHLEFGRELLDRIDRDLTDIAVCEMKYKMEGRSMISYYVPDRIKIQNVKRLQEREAKALQKAEAEEQTADK